MSKPAQRAPLSLRSPSWSARPSTSTPTGITPLALWNARAAGHDAEQVVDALVSFSRYAVPQPLLVDIVDVMARYGRLQLVKSPVHGLTLVSLDRAVLEEVLRNKKIAADAGCPHRRRHRDRAQQRARPHQADAAQNRLAR